MNAISLIKNIGIYEPAMSKLETAEIILDELYRMKSMKGTSFFAVRRAIKMQEKVIKSIKS